MAQGAALELEQLVDGGVVQPRDNGDRRRPPSMTRRPHLGQARLEASADRGYAARTAISSALIVSSGHG